MKILYVITGLGGGGAEKVVADLADQMSNLGHDVKIAYLKGINPVVTPVSKRIELVYLGFESLINFYIASKKIRKIIKNFQPDVVHSHMVHANIFVRLNRIFIKIHKLICTAHNSNEGGKLRMLSYQLTDSLSDINTNVSVEALDSFIEKKAFNNNAIAIYNGINLNKFKFINRNGKDDVIAHKKLLAVGRLSHQKDYPNLLEALFLMKNKGYVFKMFIVGDGDLKNHIIDLINKYGLENHIELLGRRDDIPDLMSKSDIFVLSSRFEGFGLVVAEAMACNTFVIGTDCGGVKEVMGETGKLVPIQNSVALANAICEVLELTDSSIRDNNLLARKRVEDNFSLQASVNKWLELYAS